MFVCCLFDRASVRDHPCILDLIDPRGPKFIARSLAISLRKFATDFLDPKQVLKIICV